MVESNTMNKSASLSDTAILFPGQGTQFVGMGFSDAARQSLEKADAQLNYPLSTICQRGPDHLLNTTQNAQLAIYTVSYALYETLFGANTNPLCFAGHSLGEYTALAASGALSFHDGLALVNRRSQVMSQCHGGMTAIIGLDFEQMQALLDTLTIDDLWISNVNTDKQIVLSGSPIALERIETALKDVHAARLVKRLEVQVASHCPLMAPAADELDAALKDAPIVRPRVPILCSTSISLCQEPAAIRSNLYQQLKVPLNWADCIRLLASQGVKRFIEIGPQSVLKSMVKRLVDVECVSYTEADIE